MRNTQFRIPDDDSDCSFEPAVRLLVQLVKAALFYLFLVFLWAAWYAIFGTEDSEN